MNTMRVLGSVLALAAMGCASYNSEGYRLRTTTTRFDAQSLTSPLASYTLAPDGTWGGLRGDRYEKVGDDIRKVGAYSPTPSLIRPSGWVSIDRRPDGVMFTPSWLSAPVWTFITEDGQAIPADLEVPLYLATVLGLDGHWVNLWTPGSEYAGIELQADCGMVFFDLQGRQVAGWAARQGAVCPAPRYPGKSTLAKLSTQRHEIWESPTRPEP
jgi:hypothetical protein